MKRASFTLIVLTLDHYLLAVDGHGNFGPVFPAQFALGAFDIDHAAIHGDLHAVDDGNRFISNS